MKKAQEFDPNDLLISEELIKATIEFNRMKNQNNERILLKRRNKKIESQNYSQNFQQNMNKQNKIPEKRISSLNRNKIVENEIKMKNERENFRGKFLDNELNMNRKFNLSESKINGLGNLKEDNMDQNFKKKCNYELSFEINPNAEIPDEIKQLGK